MGKRLILFSALLHCQADQWKTTPGPESVALYGEDVFGFECFSRDDAELGFFVTDEVDDKEKICGGPP